MINTEAIPKLGFGMMRLPMKDEEIDIEQTKKMVDAYLNSGKNYFDTAYMYISGNSERAVKEALVDRYPRESFTVADKLPIWMVDSPEDRDRIFFDQLDKTGAGYFDFYLLHNIENSNWQRYQDADVFNWAKEKKEQSLIKHFGFSFHGTPELLEEVLDKHPEVEFVQIQYNYLDLDNPAVQSGRLLDILQERKIPAIIMEPVKGGTLANLPEPMEAKLKANRPDASAASWAIRFAASQPGVMTVLSGMSDEGQMNDNLKTFENFEPVTKEEEELLGQIREQFKQTRQIGCTACEYCVDGCPVQISIPDVFKAYNGMNMYGDSDRERSLYALVTQDRGKAKDCLACGQCEGVCPQHLPIIELLRQASETFD